MGYGYELTPFQIVAGLISPAILQLGIKNAHRRRRPETKLQRIALPAFPTPAPVPLPPPPPPNFTLPIVSTLGSAVPCQPTIAATDLKILPGSSHPGSAFPLLLAAAAVLLCVASSVARWRKARGAQDTPATPSSGSHRPTRSPSFTPPPRQGSPIHYPPTPHPYPVQRRRGGRDDDEDEDDQETFVNEDPFGGDDYQEDVSDKEEKNISGQTAGREEPPPPPPLPPPVTAKEPDPDPFHHLPIWWLLLFLLAITGLGLLGLAQIFPGVKNRLRRTLRTVFSLDADGAKTRTLLEHSARVIRQEWVASGGREGTRVQRVAGVDDEAMSLIVGFVAVVGLVVAGVMVVLGGRGRAVDVPQRIPAAQSAIARSEHHDDSVTRSGNMLPNASAQIMFRDETTVTSAPLITPAKNFSLPPRTKIYTEASAQVLSPNPTPASTHSQCSSKCMAVQAVAPTSVPTSTQTLISTCSQATQTSAPSSAPASTQTQASTESQSTQTHKDVACMFAAIQTLSLGPKTTASTSTQMQDVPPKYSSLSVQTDAELPPLVKVYANCSVQSFPLLPSCTVVDSAAQTPIHTAANADPITACTNVIATQTDPVGTDLQTDAPETTATAIHLSSHPEKVPSHSSNPTVFGMSTEEEIALDFGALWVAGRAGDSRSDTTSESEIGNESVWDPIFESSAFREVSVLSDIRELGSSCEDLSVVRENRWLEMIEESIVETSHGLALPVEVLVDIREEVLSDVVDLGILNSPLRESSDADNLEPVANMLTVQVLEEPSESEPEPSVLANAESVSRCVEASGAVALQAPHPIVSDVQPLLHASLPRPDEHARFMAPFKLPPDYELSAHRKAAETSEPSDFYNSDSDLDEAALAYCHPSYQHRMRKKQRARGTLQARESVQKEKRAAELERRHQEMQAEKYARDEQVRLQREDKEERARLALENRRLEEEIKSLREDVAQRQIKAEDEKWVRVFREVQKAKDAQEIQEIGLLEAELIRLEDEDRVWQSFEDQRIEEALRVQEMERALARALEQLREEQQRMQEEEVRARTAVFQAEEANERSVKERCRLEEVSKAYSWTTTRLLRQIEENRQLHRCIENLKRARERRVHEMESTLAQVHMQLQEEEQRRIRVEKDAQASAAFLHEENIKARVYHEQQLHDEHDKQRQEAMRLEGEKKQLEDHVEELQKESAQRVQEMECKIAQTHERLREEEKLRVQEEKEAQARIANLQEIHEKNLKEQDEQEQRRLEEGREDRRRQEAQLLLQKEENRMLRDHTQQQERQLQKGEEERSRWDAAMLLLDKENNQLKEELVCLKEEAALREQEVEKLDCLEKRRVQEEDDNVQLGQLHGEEAKEAHQPLAHVAEEEEQQVESLEVEEQEGPLRQTGHQHIQKLPCQEQKQPAGPFRLRPTPSTIQATLPPSKKGVFVVPKLRCVRDSPIIPPNTSPNETVNFVEARKNLHEVEDPNEPTKRSRASRQAGFGLKIQENPDGAARLKAAIQKKHEDRSLVPAPSTPLLPSPSSPSPPYLSLPPPPSQPSAPLPVNSILHL